MPGPGMSVPSSSSFCLVDFDCRSGLPWTPTANAPGLPLLSFGAPPCCSAESHVTMRSGKASFNLSTLSSMSIVTPSWPTTRASNNRSSPSPLLLLLPEKFCPPFLNSPRRLNASAKPYRRPPSPSARPLRRQLSASVKLYRRPPSASARPLNASVNYSASNLARSGPSLRGSRFPT